MVGEVAKPFDGSLQNSATSLWSEVILLLDEDRGAAMLKTSMLLVLMVSFSPWSFGPTTVAAGASVIEFSADTLDTGPQDETVFGKMFVGKQGFRKEYSRQDKQVIEIMNHQEQVSWILFPEERTYFERPGALLPQSFGEEGNAGVIDPCDGVPESVSCEKLGIEAVHGRETEKWEIVSTYEGQTSRMVQWIDRARGIPLKQEFPGGSSEYRMTGKEVISGRETEKWEHIQSQQQGQRTLRTLLWYDPHLNLTIREELPGGQVRKLKNIQEGPQPASLFELPQGYTEKQMPSLQQDRPGGRPGSYPSR